MLAGFPCPARLVTRPVTELTWRVLMSTWFKPAGTSGVANGARHAGNPTQLFEILPVFTTCLMSLIHKGLNRNMKWTQGFTGQAQ